MLTHSNNEPKKLIQSTSDEQTYMTTDAISGTDIVLLLDAIWAFSDFNSEALLRLQNHLVQIRTTGHVQLIIKTICCLHEMMGIIFPDGIDLTMLSFGNCIVKKCSETSNGVNNTIHRAREQHESAHTARK